MSSVRSTAAGARSRSRHGAGDAGRIAMTVRPGFIAVTRAAAFTFLLATALYGVAAYSPFGYELFVKPHAVVWLVWCLTYFDALSLGVLSLASIGLAADLQRQSTRALAGAFIATGALLVAYLF